MKRLLKRWPAFLILSVVALFCFAEIRLASDRDSQGYLTDYHNTTDAGITGPPAGSPGFGQSILDSEIRTDTVAYWPLSDLTDEVGSHTLTNNGSAIFTNTGLFDNSVTLNGTTQYLSAVDSDDWYFGSGDWIFSLWFRTTDITKYQALFSQGTNGVQTIAFDYVNTDRLQMLFLDSSTVVGSYITTGTVGVTNNVWTHIAFVRQGSNGYIFVNGVSQALTITTAFGTLPNCTGDIGIGWYEPGSGNYVFGNLDEVTISKGMTFANANEVQEVVSSLYENGIGINWKTNKTTVNGNDSNTVLYLTGAGEDGDTITQDVGAGTTKHPVTFVGNAQIDTAKSKYSNGSYLFDGAGDYLTTPAHADFDLGSGAFTVDFWINFADLNTGYVCGNTYSSGWAIYWDGVNFNFYANNLVRCATTSFSASTSTWYHIAFVREAGGAMTVYKNGVSNNTNTYTGTVPNNGTMRIGDANEFSDQLNCSISHFRISDSARWTSGFTLNSSFYPLDWKWDNDSSVKLLLHMDDTGLTDSSASAHTITKNGDVARSSTKSKFGGYSAVFDGTGDYLSASYSTDWNFGSGDFTVDLWANSNGGNDKTLVAWHTSDANGGWAITTKASTGEIGAWVYISGVWQSIGFDNTLSGWQHLALVRDGATITLYVDGVAQATTYNASTNAITNASNSSLFIGARTNGTSQYFNGYIDELRISKGVARWTEDFIVPFVPYGTTWGQ